jgi:N-acetylneuraminic acid mutarotase
MKSLPVILILIMLVTTETFAQKRPTIVQHWQIAGQLPASPGQKQPIGFAGPVAGISNNILLVGGGANFPAAMPWEGGKKKYYDDVFVYHVKDNRLQLLEMVYKLNEKIAYAASCTTSRGVLYAGGENENGISNRTRLLRWNKADQKIDIEELAALPLPVTNAAAAIHNNMVYLAGGETAAGVSNHFFCLDLNQHSPAWHELPALPVPVSHMVLIAGTTETRPLIYLAGGRKKNANGLSDLYNNFYVFDINENKWVQKKSLPCPLMAGTGIACGADNILLFGGDTGKQFHETELLAQSINQTGDSTLKEKLIKQKNALQAAHPGFSKTVLLYNAGTDEWIAAGEMEYPAQVTTLAINWNGKVLIPGGEIRAGVRTPLITEATLNCSP